MIKTIAGRNGQKSTHIPMTEKEVAERLAEGAPGVQEKDLADVAAEQERLRMKYEQSAEGKVEALEATIATLLDRIAALEAK